MTRLILLFILRKNPCAKTQCPVNSRCYSDFEHDSYLCVCSPRFTGERCEIGECNALGTTDSRVLFSFYSLVF